jgi:hypothetical protein
MTRKLFAALVIAVSLAFALAFAPFGPRLAAAPHDNACGDTVTANIACSIEALLKKINNTLASTTPSAANATATTAWPRARIAAAATNNATSVKASAGAVAGWSLYNNAAAARFVKLYDKATAPTCGTDTPVLTIGLAASGGRAEFNSDVGQGFATGIAYCIVTGIADADNTATAANDVHGALLFK